MKVVFLKEPTEAARKLGGFFSDQLRFNHVIQIRYFYFVDKDLKIKLVVLKLLSFNLDERQIPRQNMRWGEKRVEIEHLDKVCLRKRCALLNGWDVALCLSVWVFVCSFVSKYVEMAEPIGLNVFVGPRITPRKGNDDRIYQKFASIKMLFLKISKIHEIFFIKSAKSFVCSCFTMYIKRTFSQWKWKITYYQHISLK